MRDVTVRLAGVIVQYQRVVCLPVSLAHHRDSTPDSGSREEIHSYVCQELQLVSRLFQRVTSQRFASKLLPRARSLPLLSVRRSACCKTSLCPEALCREISPMSLCTRKGRSPVCKAVRYVLK